MINARGGIEGEHRGAVKKGGEVGIWYLLPPKDEKTERDNEKRERHPSSVGYGVEGFLPFTINREGARG